jgi:hypothetical protein
MGVLVMDLILAIDVGIRNLATCTLQRSADDEKVWHLAEWRSIPLVDASKPVKGLAMDTLAESVAAALSALCQRLGRSPDLVVIENQPCLQNPTMKTLQVILFSWFCFQTPAKVQLVAAASKLKGWDSVIEQPQEIAPTNAEGKHSKYSETKRRAVALAPVLAERYIANYRSGGFADAYEAARKRDDLADALLHALVVLRGKGMLRAVTAAPHPHQQERVPPTEQILECAFKEGD